MAELIQRELQKFDSPEKTEIFFSAHGVPVSYVEQVGLCIRHRSSSSPALQAEKQLPCDRAYTLSQFDSCSRTSAVRSNINLCGPRRSILALSSWW